jgi:osmotically-inducible protein OsmY
MAIITISRGSFAGGKAVAERLGQRLGQSPLSRENVLAQAAKEYGVQEAELTKTLNAVPHFWQQALGKRLAYLKCVTAVLFDHASAGSLLYHGHVGHLLFAGLSRVLKVRVIADMEHRIQLAMDHAKIKRDEAIAHIHHVDESRRRWARLLYSVDWEGPSQYSVILNVGQISVDGACETIERMSELADFQPTPESQKRFDDLRLSSKVWATLAKDPVTRSAGIDVVADGGDVVITGSVGSSKALELIPRIASTVEGVKAVRCEAGMGADWYW